MKIKGTITRILEAEGGTSKAGKEWKKQRFLIDTKEAYNNIIVFEVFGEDKVENLNKYNKIGDKVEVSFNIQTNEWNDKFFTSLQAWKIYKVTEETENPQESKSEDTGSEDDLPF